MAAPILFGNTEVGADFLNKNARLKAILRYVETVSLLDSVFRTIEQPLFFVRAGNCVYKPINDVVCQYLSVSCHMRLAERECLSVLWAVSYLLGGKSKGL